MNEEEKQVLKQVALEGAAKEMPQLMALLEKICSVDSCSGDVEGNAKVIALLESLLAELGAEVEKVVEPDLGTHLIARVRPQEAAKGRVLLAAHLDNVFAAGLVEKHPFHIEGDWAHGLGTGDCKSGVLIALYGALILKKENKLPNWELDFLFTCDKEIGSASGSKVYAREAEGADYALVFEGAYLDGEETCFVTSRRGVILGDIDVIGKEAHAGLDYLSGHSATHELAHQIVRLYSFNELEKGIYYNVAPISGGRPNGIVAGEAHAGFCVAGIPANADFKGIEEKLDTMPSHVTVDGTTVKVSYHTLFPAMEVSEQNHKAYALLEEPARLMGMKPSERGERLATDAAYLSTYGVPTVDALGALAVGIHTTEEKVCISSIQERVALCALILGMLP